MTGTLHAMHFLISRVKDGPPKALVSSGACRAHRDGHCDGHQSAAWNQRLDSKKVRPMHISL